MGKQLKPLAVALGCLLALAACTEPSASPQTVGPVTAPPGTSWTGTTTTAAASALSPIGSTPSTSTENEITNSKSDVSESVILTAAPALSNITITIPQKFSNSDYKIAETAIAAFATAFEISDAAYSAPTAKDWSTELSLYWAGTALEKQLAGTSGFKENGWHAIGTRTVAGEVLEIAASSVNVRACVDDSGYDILDADGLSRINRGEGPPRVAIYRITNFPSQGWLIDSLEVPEPVEIC